MASIRRTRAGRWRVTVRLPDGKHRSATLNTRTEAQNWGDATEAAPGARFDWSPDGLTIFVPEELITMDMAHKLEGVLREALGAEP
ncbi:hypothetical protein MF672_039135 [Actinomadura sp. ATCC 31491]|uniref:Integrase n=1 Tax=Actinomadura luzonensis TaxID=2805427 RepID=A0ABT0G578_9ACTN|nr:hypothetical protein [Actinomadura luzonensis]MCK2219770.1 hypothetical protein [Actinomadura luzonensis]